MSDFTVQELTLGQLLENTAARFPDTDAVIHADRELRQTWSEFSACVDDMARGLMAIGVQKGEKVAVWATNVPHWVTLMFATTHQKEGDSMGLFKKKNVKKSYDRECMKPVIRASICTGEQVAGFKDMQTGKLEEIMLIKSPKDLDDFKNMFGITEEIEKEY